MHATRPFGPIGVPVAWRARTWAELDDADDLRLRFVHTGGATRGMDVTWHITPRARRLATSRSTTSSSRRLPLLGSELFPRIVDRLFVRPIAGRTLTTFKTPGRRSTP